MYAEHFKIPIQHRHVVRNNGTSRGEHFVESNPSKGTVRIDSYDFAMFSRVIPPLTCEHDVQISTIFETIVISSYAYR